MELIDSSVTMLRQAQYRALIIWILLGTGLLLISAACGFAEEQEAAVPTIIVRVETPVADGQEDDTAVDSAYPGPATVEFQPQSEPGYPDPKPTPEGMLSEPPDPDRSLPAAAGDTGVVGGVLVRELIEEQGYLPVKPNALFLAEVVKTDTGVPAYVRQNSTSPRADLFETGVFLFNSVPSGRYGLVVDLGFTQFQLTDTDGKQILITVEPGDAHDLGQVFVNLPADG